MKNLRETTRLEATESGKPEQIVRLIESRNETTSAPFEHSGLPIVLIVGDPSRAEMRHLMTWLRERILSAARTAFARDVAGVKTTFATNEFPDLIVVLQGWSNEYSTSDVNDLFAFAPLARLVLCYGAWCESDGRNLNLWPLSVRVPVWAAHCRINAEWQLIRAPGEQRTLPWSASREEVFAADHQLSLPWDGPQTFVIDSPDSEYRRFLAEMLLPNNHAMALTNPTVLLFDADPWGGLRAQALQVLRDQFPHAEVFVLISLARPTDIAEFQQLGLKQVIHKLGFRSRPS